MKIVPIAITIPENILHLKALAVYSDNINDDPAICNQSKVYNSHQLLPNNGEWPKNFSSIFPSQMR